MNKAGRWFSETKGTADREAHRRNPEWDIGSGSKNYAILIAAQAVGSLSALVAIWIATRELGAGGYGGVVAILAGSQLVSQLAVQWTGISLSRYGCEEFVQTGRIADAFWARSLVLTISLLILVLLSPAWLPSVASLLHIPAGASYLVLLHLLITSIWLHVQFALQGAKLIRLQGILLAIERILLLFILIILVVAGHTSLVSVVWGYILAPLLMSAVGLWRLCALIYPTINLNRDRLKQMLVFSFPLLPYSIVGYLSTNYLDAIFITGFLSIDSLGVYAVAYQLAGTTMQLPLLAGTLLMPLFVTFEVSDGRKRAMRFLNEVLPSLILIWATACIILAFLGSYLFPLAFGPRFQQTSSLLWPLMAASALAGPVLMGYAPYANTIAATHIPAMAATVSAGVNVTLNALLIPRFGLPGCAWATAIAYAASVVVANWLVHRRAQFPRTWIHQAFAPILLGSAWGSWRGANLEALAVALTASAVVAFVQRRALVAGLVSLKENSSRGTGLEPIAKP